MKKGDLSDKFDENSDAGLQASRSTFLGGEIDPNETPEQKRQRKEQWARLQKQLDEEAEQQEKDNQKGKKAGEDKEDPNVKQANEKYKGRKFGIKDKDDYLKVSRPTGEKDPRTGERMVSDNQLRAMILKGAFDKGFKEMRFYKGYELDHQLTSRAQDMLGKMVVSDKFLTKGERELLGGVQIISSPMKRGAEPWAGPIRRCVTGPCKQWNHERKSRRAVKKEGKWARKHLKKSKDEEAETKKDIRETFEESAKRDRSDGKADNEHGHDLESDAPEQVKMDFGDSRGEASPNRSAPGVT